jgi:hypothetical protein
MATRECPLKGRRSSLVVGLECQQALFQFDQGGEIVGRENLSLNNGEVDLDLVEPTRVNWGVDEQGVRPFGPQSINGFLTAMGRAVVHDPKDATGGLVWFLAHDFTDHAIHRSNPAFDFAAPKDLGAMDIPSGQVSPSAVTKILVFNPCDPVGSRRQGRLLAAAGLNTCLFVKAHHEVIGPQWEAIPDTFVEIEDRAGFGSEVGVARKDPASMLPRSQCITAEPTPQCGAANFGDKTLRNYVLPDLLDGKPGQGKSEFDRKLTSQGLNLNDEAGGKSGLYARLEAAPQGQAFERERIACATCSRSDEVYPSEPQ